MLYALFLCAAACLFYNIFPSAVLNVLTGKVYPQTVLLGRFFSVSMSFFTLSYVLILYFLSLKELHFIKYLVFFTVLQAAAIFVFHHSIYQVQAVLCINSVLLFSSHLWLAYRYRKNAAGSFVKEAAAVV